MRCSMSVAWTYTWPIHSQERTCQWPYIRLELNLRTSTLQHFSLYPHLDSKISNRRLSMTRSCKPWKLSSCMAGQTIVVNSRADNPLHLHERWVVSTQWSDILRAMNLIVLISLRKDMKWKLHASLLGTGSCLQRARETIFWPNTNAELKEMIATCETCCKYETSHQKESLIPHKAPNWSWEY